MMKLAASLIVHATLISCILADTITIQFPKVMNPRHKELQTMEINGDRPDLAEFLATTVPKQYELIKKSNLLYQQEQDMLEKQRQAKETFERKERLAIAKAQRGDPNAPADVELRLSYAEGQIVSAAVKQMRLFAYIANVHVEQVSPAVAEFPKSTESEIFANVHSCLAKIADADGLKIDEMSVIPKFGGFKMHMKHTVASSESNYAVFGVDKATKLISLKFDAFSKKSTDEQAFILVNAAARALCSFGSRDGWLVEDPESLAYRSSLTHHELKGGAFTNANRLEAFVRKMNGFPLAERLHNELQTTQPRYYKN